MSTSARCKSATVSAQDLRPPETKQHTGILKEPTIEEVALYLKELPPLTILVLSGGRISQPLGIPDLRSPDVGLHQAPFEGECYCCDALDKKYFIHDPAPLYKITSFILEREYRPTYSHYFISFLEHKNLLLKNYTQNMDDLEKVAGITRYTQFYGNFYSFVCIKCGNEYSLEWVRARLLKKKIMLCNNCASLIKPNILLYGEDLPMCIYEELEADLRVCKLLIVLGSTISNEPLATVLQRVDFKYPRIFITDVDPYNFSDYHFYCKHDHNDVIWFGNIDFTCNRLVKLAGWCQEMEEFTKDNLLEQGECETIV